MVNGPGAKTGRVWLFGIFRYVFNFKSIFKTSGLARYSNCSSNYTLVLLLIGGTQLNTEPLIVETLEGVMEMAR